MRELGRHNAVIGWCLFVLVCVGTDSDDEIGINTVCKVGIDNFSGVGIGDW